MRVNTAAELVKAIAPGIEVSSTRVRAATPAALRGDAVDRLAFNAVFGGDPTVRGTARWIIRALAAAEGIVPASIHELYMAMGRGETGGFTVPAVNVRGMAYDTARAIVRAARAGGTGAFIFEIARSEIGYTDQRPAEYAAIVMAAALREGHRGPVFIQGDHTQVNAKKFATERDKELSTIRKLIEEEIAAGFYNIDIDTSTLVDLSKPTLEEQQRVNFELAAEFTEFIRRREPAGVTISVGAEIGEVGGKNSDVHELHAFMDGYNAAVGSKGVVGISKISVQTGTSHGGVVLPDGSIAQVKIDFGALEELSRVAREQYHLSGAVQHGASTLPAEAFDKFPKVGACEIHLATEFQNMLYENPGFPKDLREEIYGWLRTNAAEERKPKDTEEQFIYKTRKKALGPFKERFWTLPADARQAIGQALEKKFAFLFEKLNVVDTADAVKLFVRPKAAEPDRGREIAAAGGMVTAAERDAKGLAD